MTWSQSGQVQPVSHTGTIGSVLNAEFGQSGIDFGIGLKLNTSVIVDEPADAAAVQIHATFALLAGNAMTFGA